MDILTEYVARTLGESGANVDQAAASGRAEVRGADGSSSGPQCRGILGLTTSWTEQFPFRLLEKFPTTKQKVAVERPFHERRQIAHL
jgi:hypothetical protein